MQVLYHGGCLGDGPELLLVWTCHGGRDGVLFYLVWRCLLDDRNRFTLTPNEIPGLELDRDHDQRNDEARDGLL